MTPDAVEPQGWRPSEGDTLTGTVVDLDSGWSDYQNADYPIVHIRQDDGTVVAVHCFHHVLLKQMVAKQPRVGDRIEVSHLGQRATKDGKRQVTLYRVTLPERRTDSQTFWQGMGAQNPQRDAVQAALEPDVPIDDSDIPF